MWASRGERLKERMRRWFHGNVVNPRVGSALKHVRGIGTMVVKVRKNWSTVRKGCYVVRKDGGTVGRRRNPSRW
jgi:hypothetical protein